MVGNAWSWVRIDRACISYIVPLVRVSGPVYNARATRHAGVLTEIVIISRRGVYPDPDTPE